MAREKGGKKAEDASFKTLLDRLDNGLDRPPGGAEGLGVPDAVRASETARVVPMPGMRPPPSPLHAGEPISPLAGFEAKVEQHEAARGLRKSGLLAACFTGGLTSLGVIWLVITYWSIGSGRVVPSIEQASAAPARPAAGSALGADGAGARVEPTSPAASLLVTSFAPAGEAVDPDVPRTSPSMAAAASTSTSEPEPARPPSAETVPASETVPAAAKPADATPAVVAPRVVAPRVVAPLVVAPLVVAQETAPTVNRPTAALPPADRSLTYAASETKLLVAPQSRAIAGESSPLAIKVDAPGLVVDKLQVIVGGLPAGAFLSAGTARGPDTWQVPVRGLEALLIRLPVATREDVTLTLDLTDGAGASLARATTLIAVLPSALPLPQEVAKAPPPAPAPTAAAPSPAAQAPQAETTMPPRLTMDETTALIERGRLLVRNGDIASARLMFERAADAGSGRAAYLMGETFDPDVLASLRALGLRGDVVKARQWYNRANELGTPAAVERLRALAGR